MRVNLPRQKKGASIDLEAVLVEVEQSFARVRDTTAGTGMPATAPATATSTGKAGQFAYDATHFYVCVAADTWVRTLLATF